MARARKRARVTIIEPHARYITGCSHPGCPRFASYTVQLPGDRLVWKCVAHLATDHRIRF